MERDSMRTNLEILISFDLIITTSITQSDDESMSVSVNRMVTEQLYSSFLEQRVTEGEHEAEGTHETEGEWRVPEGEEETDGKWRVTEGEQEAAELRYVGVLCRLI